ncbi:MAG: hypothetical protein JHD07_01925 [Bradyrhizobium sp.]|uniref:hypothetical protein n=1 Tax=Bradyrhizobium sp. TaxID=376 RepID=UPI001A32948C|nr:hypothetical protein [Bradyrhizobium sp.]MBJ7402113.1 hypothetical protein [Bradyrhizobium sp.]
MSVMIKISVDDDSKFDVKTSEGTDTSRTLLQIQDRVEDLSKKVPAKPFPRSALGGYMSHFRIVIELKTPPKDTLVSIVSPLAGQTVSWSDPFIYRGRDYQHKALIEVPSGVDLPGAIYEADFRDRPEEFFEVGKETVWLQILNLDARINTKLGDIRIILGATLKDEYPDLFKPSFGIAQSLGKDGFPARLYFNPYAVIETPVGAFRAIHGTLVYGHVTDFPPIGTPVSIADCIPLEPVDQIRSLMARGKSLDEITPDMLTPAGRIVALSHPIDMKIQLKGEEAYRFVERCIAGSYN